MEKGEEERRNITSPRERARERNVVGDNTEFSRHPNEFDFQGGGDDLIPDNDRASIGVARCVNISCAG